MVRVRDAGGVTLYPPISHRRTLHREARQTALRGTKLKSFAITEKEEGANLGAVSKKGEVALRVGQSPSICVASISPRLSWILGTPPVVYETKSQ